MQRVNNFIKAITKDVPLKIVVMVLVAVIVSATIGGNGCLWVGNTGQDDTSGGSSGALTAYSPYPAQGTTGVPITAQLSWGSVSGMTSYDIYFGTVNTPPFQLNIASIPVRTKYNPGVLNYDTLYYWRVDSKNAQGTKAGAVWSFRTIAQTTGIANPFPAQGVTNVPVNVTLTWDDYNGAASYDVYFGFKTPPSFVTNVVTASFRPSSVVYGATYYWRVRARDAGGAVIADGVVWNFSTVPELLQADSPSPANGVTNASINASLSWASSVGASNYDVYFSTTNPPSFIANVSKTLFRTRYTPNSELLYSTLYYWRIDAKDDNGGVVTGALWSFTTLPALPDAASSPVPVNSAVGVPITTTMSWAQSARATSYDVYFGANGGAMEYRTNTTGVEYNPGRLNYITQYNWRIDARNLAGVIRGSGWTFTTAAQAMPVQASSPSPVDGSIDCLINTQITWLSSNDAVSYDIYFGTGGNLPFITNVSKTIYRTRYTPGTLTYGTTYYWRINARNSGGATTGLLWHFTTQPSLPAQASSPDPTNGKVDCPITQTLSWAVAARADTYDVYFGTTTAGWTAITTTSLLQYAPAGLAYNLTYYWRVDSKNFTGMTIGANWSFSTLSLPDKVLTIAPLNGATGVLTNQVLRWNAAAKATSYDVYFGQTTTGWVPAANITTLQYTPALNYNNIYYWQIDSRNAVGVTAGDIMTFTTVSMADQVAAGFPENNATLIPINNLTLTWTAAARAEVYDVYFGISQGSLSRVISGTISTSYGLPTLGIGITYYWRVDARNQSGATTGIVWNFTTLPYPGKANTPNPADLAINVPLTSTLVWTAGLNTEHYEIYFGTSTGTWTTPIMTTTGTAYNPGILVTNTTYYWKVNSVNSSGTTMGDVWSFMTALPSKLTFVQQPSNTIAGSTITPAITVLVQDFYDNIVPGVTVSLTTTDGTSINGTLTRVSDNSGFATFDNLSMTTAGAYYLIASLGTVNTTSTSFTILPGSASKLIWGTMPASPETAGATWPSFTVQLEDIYNNLCTNDNSTVVTVVTVTGTTGFATGNIATASAGVATFSNVSYNKAETITIKGTANGLAGTPDSPAIAVNPASPNSLVWLSSPAVTQTAGTIWDSFTVAVKDAYNNLCVNDNSTVITLAIVTGTSALSGTQSVQSVAGIATFNNVTYTKAETIIIKGTATGLSDTAATNSITVNPAVANKLVWGSAPANTQTAGTAWSAFTILVKDAYDNLCTGNNSIVVTVVTSTGTTGFASGNTVTASAGTVTFSNALYNKAETITVKGTAAGLTSTPDSGSITVNAASANKLAFTINPPITITVGTTLSAIAVAVEDFYNNIIPNATDTITITAVGTFITGTLSADAVSGVATFTNLQIDTLAAAGCRISASAVGLSAGNSSAFDVVASMPSTLAFTVEPATSVPAGTAFDPALQVAIEDTYGNIVLTSSQSITITGIGTALSGTLTRNAVTGVATFTGVAVGTSLATGCVVSATSAGLADVTSTSFDILSGPPAQLFIVQQPTSATAGAVITPAVQVNVQDQYGINVPNALVSITTTNGVLMNGTLAQRTGLDGVATFNNLSIGTAGTGYTLRASCAGTPGITSIPFDIAAAPASRLVFIVQPTTTIIAGAAFSPTLLVAVQDNFGNTISTAVDVTIAGSGTTLGGTLTQTSVLGIATFTGVTAGTAAGTGMNISASATGLTSATSNTFNIIAGPASALVFIQQPTNATAGIIISPAMTVQVLDQYGNTVAGTQVSISVTNGTIIYGTLTQSSVSNGVAVFNDLIINAAGIGYTISVSAVGCPSIISNTFDIVPAAAVRLVFIVQPTTATAGAGFAPALQVAIQDSLGNTIPTSLSITIVGNGTTLGGTLTQTAVLGVATFSDVTVGTAAATGVTVSVSGSGLTGVTSNTFNIVGGTATTLVFVQQPATTSAGAIIFPPVTVRARDVFGNNAPNMDISIGTVSGTALGGTTTRTTDSNGIATFDNLSIALIGNYSLIATFNAITVTSNAFNVVYSPPSYIGNGNDGTISVASGTFNLNLANPQTGVTKSQSRTAADGWYTRVNGFDVTGSTASVSDTIPANTFAPGDEVMIISLKGTISATSPTGVANVGNYEFLRVSSITASGFTFITPKTKWYGDIAGSDANIGTTQFVMLQRVPNYSAVTLQANANITCNGWDGTKGGVIAFRVSGTLLLAQSTSIITADGKGYRGGAGVQVYSAQAYAGETYLRDSYPSGGAIRADATTPTAVPTNIYGGGGGGGTGTWGASSDNTTYGAAGAPGPSGGGGGSGGDMTSPSGGGGGGYGLVGAGSPGGLGTSSTRSPGASGSGTNGGAGGNGRYYYFDDGCGNTGGDWYSGGGGGGGSYGDSSILNSIAYLGAGGGAGGGALTTVGGKGGNGGGLIFIGASTINNAAGLISAQGQPGQTATQYSAGGGGAGGSIILMAIGLTNTPTGGITVAGGTAGTDSWGSGGDGGAGRTFIQSASNPANPPVPGGTYYYASGYISFLSQPTNTAAGAAIAPPIQVQVTDANNNSLSGVSVTITTASGTPLSGTLTATTVGGVATFSDLFITTTGVYNLRAYATVSGTVISGLSRVFRITAGGTLSSISFTQQPVSTVAGATIPEIDVTALDQFGNPFGGGVPIALTTNAQLNGTTSENTDTNGVVRFTDLSITTSGSYILTATSGSLTGVASNSFNIVGGSAVQLAWASQPVGQQDRNTAWGSYAINALDVYNNLATGFTGNVTVNLVSGTGTLSGNTVAAIGGVATFNATSYNAVETITVRGTAAGLTSTPVSGNIVVSAFGNAVKLAFIYQLPSSLTVGSGFGSALQVEILDASNNLVSNAVNSVSITASGTTLNGTTTQNAVSGIAVFSGITAGTIGQGCVIWASSTGLTSAASSSFNVAPVSAPHQGTGIDGDIVISTTVNINNLSLSPGRTVADGWSSRIMAFDALSTTATLSDTVPANAFAAGDEALIISLRGTASGTTPTGFANVGNYEFVRVASAGSNTVTFQNPKTKWYGDDVLTDTNISATQYVMLQRVPNYDNLTLTADANLTCNSWNGVTGGVLAFRVLGSLNLRSSMLPAVPAAVYYGGAMCSANNNIYIFSGYGGNQFYRYSISGNSWSTMAAVPAAVYYGGSLAYPGTGDYIYGFTGNNTALFYRYSISANSWSTLAPITGTVYYGASLCSTGDDYIYVFNGGNTQTFYRYSISLNQWTQMANSTFAINSYFGQTLTYPGTGNYIYAVGNAANFMVYNISANTWSTLVTLPAGASYGASLCSTRNDYIYYFSGGGATSFYRYSISGNNWTTMPGTPTAVYIGGTMVYPGAGTNLYAMPGYYNTNFWVYSTVRNQWNYGAWLTANGSGLMGGLGVTSTANAPSGESFIRASYPSGGVYTGTGQAPPSPSDLGGGGGGSGSNIIGSTGTTGSAGGGGGASNASAAGSGGGAGYGTVGNGGACATGGYAGQAGSGTTGGTGMNGSGSVGGGGGGGGIFGDSTALTQTAYLGSGGSSGGGFASYNGGNGGNGGGLIYIGASSANIASTALISALGGNASGLASYSGGGGGSGGTIILITNALTNSNTSGINVSGGSGFANGGAGGAGRIIIKANTAPANGGTPAGGYYFGGYAIGAITFQQQPQSSVVAGAVISPTIQIRVVDWNYNAITGAAITITLTNGTALGGTLTRNTDSNGVAAFDDLYVTLVGSNYVIRATAVTPYGNMLANSTAFAVVPAPAVRLSVTVQPTNTVAGTAINPTVQASLWDAYNNLATSSANLVDISSLSTTLGGPITSVSPANGIVTFSGVTVGTVPVSGCTISVSSTGLTGATSVPFNIVAGVATSLVFTQQPGTTDAGSVISPSPEILASDTYGNAVPGIIISLTTTEGAFISGTIAQTTDGTGTVTFNNLVITTANSYILQATYASLSATSNAFSILSLTEVGLGFSYQPTNTQVNAAFNPSVQVAIVDTYGNTVTSATNQISITAIGTTLSGTITNVSPVGGVATFSGVTVGGSAASGCTLSATCNPALTGVTSNPFNVTLSSPSVYLGTGSDGTVTISSGTFNLNLDNPQTGVTKSQSRTPADAWSSQILAWDALSTTATISDTIPANALVTGDEVIVISLKGTITPTSPTGIANVGNYEFLTVSSAALTSVVFARPKTKWYGDTTGSDANVGVTQFVMLQRVPNYSSVTIASGGILTCQAWDGVKGGVIAFRVSGTLALNGNGTAAITADGKGHRGGSGGQSYTAQAYAGETYLRDGYPSGGVDYGNGTPPVTAPTDIYGGGGGGGTGSWYNTSDNYTSGAGGAPGPSGGGGGSGGDAIAPSGGGGGGYGFVGSGSPSAYNRSPGANGSGTSGGAGGGGRYYYYDDGCGNTGGDWYSGGGGGGGVYGDSSILNNVAYLGAGGGAGGGYSTTLGGYGGNGGGLVFIGAGIVNNATGTISARGQAGQTQSGFSAGGGGAGGSIIIVASSVINASSSGGITVSGGAAGVDPWGAGGPGGGGRCYIKSDSDPAPATGGVYYFARAQLSFQTQPSSTVAGTAISPAVSVLLQGVWGDSLSGVQVSLTTTNGTFLNGATATTNSSGIATFNSAVITGSGTYSLSASATVNGLALSPAVSRQFTVTAATADHMLFSVQPTATVYNSAFSPAVVVAVVDLYNNTIITDTGAHTVTLTPNVTSFSGTIPASTYTNVPTVGGLVTFTGLAVNGTGGLACYLTAAAAPALPTNTVQSSNFVVSGTVSWTINPTSVQGQTGTIQTWTVPWTGNFTIQAYGAQGGYAYLLSTATINPGCYGAGMRGDFALTSGQAIRILVGQQGVDNPNSARGGGGGGGTFVYNQTTTTLLIAAGGGGGAGQYADQAGGEGQIGTSGTAGTYGLGGAGGTGGAGGAGSGYFGGGGAGWNSNGGNGGYGYAYGGQTFANGGAGGNLYSDGQAGGFGGGGGSYAGAGGGGGYSGGGGGGWSYSGRGGGGGSYNTGANQSNSPGVRSGGGLVIITAE